MASVAYPSCLPVQQFISRPLSRSVPSHSSEPSTSTPKPPTPRSRTRRISTLDSNHIQPSDYIYLSTHQTAYVRIAPRGSQDEYGRVILRYEIAGHDYTPFPQGTRGYLYYARAHDLAEGGQVRFRVVAAPGDFAAGTDLLFPGGGPWHVRPGLFSGRNNSALAKLLLRDGLVTRAQLAVWDSFPKSLTRTTVVARFGQPFQLDFTLYAPCFWIRTSDRARAVRFWLAKGNYLSRGTGLVCLEPSPLPEHAGRRIAVMRVLEILEPAECQPGLRFVPFLPVPGELLVHPRSGWVVSFEDGRDSPRKYGLESLWEDYERSKSDGEATP
ncbi:hypothetical protein BC834DRAFT_182082 [Gloeopeniophorella convolvens]|nr:hypothetical protein BC834DRAFT_182082 [Gloeopeniophorella convolvens]